MQPAETAADHDDAHLVGERRAVDRFDVRVEGQVRESAFDLPILFVAVVAQAPVALGAVLARMALGSKAS